MDQYGLYDIAKVICAIGAVGVLGSGYASYQKRKSYLITQAVDFGMKYAPVPEKEEAQEGNILKALFRIGPGLADERFNEGKFDAKIDKLIAKEAKRGRIYLE